MSFKRKAKRRRTIPGLQKKRNQMLKDIKAIQASRRAHMYEAQRILAEEDAKEYSMPLMG